jgi:hypothetical protein
MKVTALSLVPPPAAENNPKVTPELLASCLAKYSRSIEGIDKILSTVDWSNPDKSVDAIFKFVDYGHASIGGLTGGIPIAIDGVSLYLAYKLFELAQLSDGQESSTRYIQLTPEGLPTPEEIGIPTELATEWKDLMAESLEYYQKEYLRLDTLATEHPELIRMPAGTPEKVMNRIRKNYALDRARYFIPFALKTNIALVMTARVWAQTIRLLDSYPFPEFQKCSEMIRGELQKYAPRLIKHSAKDDASTFQAIDDLQVSVDQTIAGSFSDKEIQDEVFTAIDVELPTFLSEGSDLKKSFESKRNRYSTVGRAVRRQNIRFAWNNIALAELRDLNRHRSGYRYTSLTPVGFYLPPEIERNSYTPFLKRYGEFLKKLAKNSPAGTHHYAYLLGVQVPFEHSTQLDKFIYEVELRTGMGAHYRYAEHLRIVCEDFLTKFPEYRSYIEIGSAEPE